MKLTINVDDELLEAARDLTGTMETTAIVHQALETLVRVETGRRLIALGGTMPDAEAVSDTYERWIEERIEMALADRRPSVSGSDADLQIEAVLALKT